MFIQTGHFGGIEINNDDILYFKSGIPGFENVKKYVIIENEDKESPFKWLQSVDEPNLAFAIVDPFYVKKDYDMDISDDITAVMEIERAEDVEVYSIVVVPEDTSKISMNLKAPVIINKKNHRAMQVVLDTDKYSVRHYIIEELRKQEVAKNACSD